MCTTSQMVPGNCSTFKITNLSDSRMRSGKPLDEPDYAELFPACTCISQRIQPLICAWDHQRLHWSVVALCVQIIPSVAVQGGVHWAAGCLLPWLAALAAHIEARHWQWLTSVSGRDCNRGQHGLSSPPPFSVCLLYKLIVNFNCLYQRRQQMQ